jgi:hypothetical protein
MMLKAIRLCVICLIGTLGSVSISNAQTTTTDVDDQVASLLQSLGKIPWARTVQVMKTLRQLNACPPLFNGGANNFCDRPIIPVTENQSGVDYITASNITLTFSDAIQFGAITQTEIPSNPTSWNQEVVNCNNVVANMAISISRQVATSVTTTLTNQLALQKGASVTVKGGSPAFSVTGQVSISQTKTTIDATAKGTTETDTRSGTSSTPVPAMSKVTGVFTVWPVVLSMPFALTVVVDADLSESSKGYHKLSDAFSAERRTLAIDGIMTVTQASEGTTKFENAVLTTAADCSASGEAPPPAPASPSNAKFKVLPPAQISKGVFGR